jgi:hypothetical protein
VTDLLGAAVEGAARASAGRRRPGWRGRPKGWDGLPKGAGHRSGELVDRSRSGNLLPRSAQRPTVSTSVRT